MTFHNDPDPLPLDARFVSSFDSSLPFSGYRQMYTTERTQENSVASAL